MSDSLYATVTVKSGGKLDVQVVHDVDNQGKRRVRMKDDAHQVVRMKLDSRIRWTLDNQVPNESAPEAWIVFEDRTPFSQHAIPFSAIDDLGQVPLLPGAFKYHVVILSKPYVSLDPVIIIDPPTP